MCSMPWKTHRSKVYWLRCMNRPTPNFVTRVIRQKIGVLTQRMGEQQDVHRRQQQISTLEKKELSPQDELDMLQDVIRQARLRQGLEHRHSTSAAQPLADEVEHDTNLAEDWPYTEQSPSN